MNRLQNTFFIVLPTVCVLICGCNKNASPDSQSQQRVDVPKESWSFAGYASPEDALKTYFWAINKQDITNFEASMTAEAQADFKKELQEAGQTTAQFLQEVTPQLKETSGYQILGIKTNAADEVDLQVVIGGGVNTNDVMTIKKVGGEWKVDEAP